MKDLANKRSGFYDDIRILLWPATGSCHGWTPLRDYRLRKPNRDITPSPQSVVFTHASSLLCNEIFRSYDDGSRCVYKALASL